jgi:hypothetical protein
MTTTRTRYFVARRTGLGLPSWRIWDTATQSYVQNPVTLQDRVYADEGSARAQMGLLEMKHRYGWDFEPR